ncbi:MAG: Fe(3+) ABC transporter substrate-binding protein [Gammaproteobacteria bacterium]|nr:Fe(3+) ABC transporter substrate-binding protein [Gammaproteobacteria bacterium]MCF6229652.1 Fe(3+) ABC transporter substrate-binding protein [Gammaproteobacteria bacterium]
MKCKQWLVLIAGVVAMWVSYSALASDEVVVYSARNEQLIKPLFDAYTKETGVEVKFVTGKAGSLMQRLKAEGENTPADLLITVDAGNLWQAANMGLLQTVLSEKLNSSIPEYLRDPENRWFGLSVRARTIVYNTGKLSDSDLSSYEDLADPKWRGKLCLRTSKKVYNQSLVAMMIAEHGKQQTESIVKGWVANLATKPFSSDTKMMQAIAAGQCEVGIGNTYYFGRLENKDPAIPLKLFWPNQQGSGVHVNISGGGVTRYASNVDGAIALLEWLASERAQNLFSDSNHEYPANAAVKPSAQVAAWGAFKANPLNVAKAGELQVEAVKLMDRAGYK